MVSLTIKTSEDTRGVFTQCTITELVESAASMRVMEIIEDGRLVLGFQVHSTMLSSDVAAGGSELKFV